MGRMTADRHDKVAKYRSLREERHNTRDDTKRVDALHGKT